MKRIKYVIWGAGAYGRRAFNAIGEDFVEAFVDSDSQKIGTIYCNKQVISLEQFVLDYPEDMLLIANRQYEECSKVLEAQNIGRYLKYQNYPSELFSYAGYNELKQYVLSMVNEDILYGIKGLSLYSLTVYYWIREKGQRAQLIISRDVSKQILSLLDLYEVFYAFEDTKEKAAPAIIFLCDYICRSKLNLLLAEHKEYRYIFDCAEKITAYHNPKLESLKNLHEGKRCFLVATGPSLLIEDLNLLKKNNEICISVNSIFKAFDKTKWRPDYYTVSDAIFASKNRTVIDALDIPYKLVSDYCVEFWEHRHDENTIKYHHSASDYCYDFSEDISRVSYGGYTVTYICMQLAVYMGFKEIYLLGTDCSYIKGSQNNYFVKEDKPDYTYHGEDKMLPAYQSAKQYADAHGIKICNATRGGRLEIFERVNFDSLF